MHYGHRLQFGSSHTADAADVAATVAMARLSEDLGYDLVTFVEHPDPATRVDPWTLLSWVAAVTDRIRLAAHVTDLPLRSPAMLARSAASLDHLSGGRVELGMDADPDGSAVEESGGPRWSPAESVDALGEAVDVVRALWSTSGPRRVRLAGTHHRLDGAETAAPAHEIPIAVGGARPVWPLIGRTADGWSVTLAEAGPDGLAAGNRAVDDAARAAGRDPREIRRGLTVSGRFTAERHADRDQQDLDGPPASWVAELLPLVVEHGVGTIVLRSDDAPTLTRFAREVVPALRAAVDAAVPHGSAGIPVRKAAALARRRPGIDYDAVPPSLSEVIEPGDLRYSRFRSGYLRGGAPGVVLRAADAGQVADALAFARAHPDLPLAVRSAGHGISGRSTNDGGIVIDVSGIDHIEVEPDRRLRVGPGARWAEVAAALEPHGWALSSGDYGGVGVGGLATAGGIGYLAREHGLTIDHLRGVEMVLADGSAVHASEAENPDLFWAVRGAGANFGIVTSFEFEVDEVGLVAFAQLVSDASDPAAVLQRWGRAVEDAPRDLTSNLILTPAAPGRPAVVHTMSVVDSADPDTVLARLQPIADIAPLLDQQVQILPYRAVLMDPGTAEHRGRGEPVSRSGLLTHITPEFAAEAARMMRSGGVHWFQIRSVGGAVSDVDPDATAYAHRGSNFSIVAMGSNPEVVDALWSRLRPFLDGLYLSFESGLHPERITDAFPPRTLARLRDLKTRYDPDNVLRDNFNIAPEKITSEGVRS